MYLDSISEKKYLLFTFGGITLFYLLLSLQGFDMCDEGWVMTGYQQIFDDPESVKYLFLYYSTQFVGGIWYQVFGNYGILAFKILAVITLVSSYYFVYLLLKGHIRRLDFILGVALIVASEPTGMMTFHHNQFTIFLYCLSSLFLYKSLCKNSILYIYISGFFLGIMIFARLTNIALVALSLTLIPFFFIKGVNRGLKMLFFAFLGTISGITLIIILMLSFNHLNIFIDNLSSGLSAAEDKESTHNLSYMIGVYLRDYYYIFKFGIYLFAPGLILWYVNKRMTINKIIFLLLIILYSGIVIFACTRFQHIILIYTFCTFWIILGISQKIKDPHFLYLAIISISILYFLPLGSDFGIGNMGSSSIYIAIPFSVSIARQVLNKLKQTQIQIPLYLFILLYVLIGGYQILSQCYFDNGWRWEKIYKIDSPMATTYTTLENKLAADELLENLSTYVHEGDYTLYFQSLPTLHFLTKTKPYLGNPWPWTYDPTNFEYQLKIAQKKHKKLPIIVREKSTVSKWQIPYKDWDNDSIPNTYSHKIERIKSIKNFIKENSYNVVWENDLFQILATK